MRSHRPLSRAAGCGTSDRQIDTTAPAIPLTNEPVAKGQVDLLFRHLNQKPMVPKLDSLPGKRRPAFRKAVSTVQNHLFDRIFCEYKVGDGKDLAYTALFLAPVRDRKRLGVFAAHVPFRDPSDAAVFSCDIEVSFHAIQRIVQRLRTTDWKDIGTEVAFGVAPLVEDPEPGEHRIQTPNGHFRAVTDDRVTTVITFINDKEAA